MDTDFEPFYVVDADKKKKVAELKRALKDADELFLATDEDREGEAIAWHLLRCSSPRSRSAGWSSTRSPATRSARAVEHTRDLDQNLVDAQETRRILDRLYGYEVSPVLWRKVRQGLSAGRVQSVATRLVVERERERMAFRSAAYWDIEATFAVAPTATGPAASTRGSSPVDGRRVATGRDFGSDGEPVARRRRRSSTRRPRRVARRRRCEVATFAVRSVEDKPYTRRPAAPFMTSTLQQEAGRKLRMSRADRDAGRAAAVRERLHHLHAHRLDDAVGGGAERRARAGPRALRPGVRAGRAAPLRAQGEERAGGARGDPPVRRLVPHAGPGGRRAQPATSSRSTS